MVAVAPRSTWIHCGSLNALDHRVPVFPSTAADAGVVAVSVDEADAGWFSARLEPVHAAEPNVPRTWNSHRETPYGVARAVAYMRT